MPAAVASVYSETSRGWLALAQVSAAAFLGFVIAVLFTRVVAAAGRLTVNRITGAITVYLLLGFVGGNLAAFIELVVPGSFTGPGMAGAETTGPAADALFRYFSFVTLATLGYGDITPATPPAHTFSWMLAVTGQMYVAIIVARLVALGFESTRD